MHRRGLLALVTASAIAALGDTPDRHPTCAPVLTHRTDPEYTPEALAARLEGVVMLSAVISTEGIPEQITVERKLGKGLDEKAVECLKQWKFTPGARAGTPAAMKALIEINFRLLHP